VAADESAATLTVTAISTMDAAKSGTATVTVTGDNDSVNSPDPVTLAELADHLDSLSANTPTSPHTVVLARSVFINTAAPSASGFYPQRYELVECI
jgi:hypothetical protein